MKIEKILCPIDFSGGSERAMAVAIRLASEANAELVLAHVWYVPPSAFAGYVFPPDVIEKMVADVKQGLDDALRSATSQGAQRVSTVLLTGTPWHEIVELVADPAFGLVVIGTHGRTGLEHVLLGSVAEKVVRHAPCSILAIPSFGMKTTFRHALCPVDFSESSRYAAELAAQLVDPKGQITLLRVLELPVSYSGDPPSTDIVGDFDQRSADLLARWAKELARTTTATVTTRSRIGRPGAQILKVLEQDYSFDFVALGATGRSALTQALIGSVAEKTVRHARRPVLVARRRDRD